MTEHNMRFPSEFLAGPTESTFHNQDKLPPLPLAPLENSLKVYLDSSKFTAKK